MMVGIDIVDVARIEQAVTRWGDRFFDKVFTEEEISYFRNLRRVCESVAGRFAAKEAFMKAKGRRLAWKDVEVLQQGGRPFIDFQGKRYDGVSISHEKSYAVSVVVI
jgi:holo-[acyl-carrier protein] synthase